MNCTECGSDHSGQITEYPTGDLVIVTGDFTGGIDITLYDPAIHTADNAPRVSVPAGSLGRVIGHCDDGRALIVFDAEKGKSRASHSFHFPGGYFVSTRKLEALPEMLAALRPFIRLWQPWMEAEPDDKTAWLTDLGPVTVGDLRAARAAIAQAEGGQ